VMELGCIANFLSKVEEASRRKCSMRIIRRLKKRLNLFYT